MLLYCAFNVEEKKALATPTPPKIYKKRKTQQIQGEEDGGRDGVRKKEEKKQLEIKVPNFC